VPRYIIKLEDQYLEWSTVVDAPVTFGMSLEEFTEYYKVEYGCRAMRFEFKDRMDRVEKTGTSALLYDSVDEVIEHNRAGKDETCLSKEQIIDFYIRNKDNPETKNPVGTKS
jgi:hypothetical protein